MPLQAYQQQALTLEAAAWVRFETPPDSAQQPVLVLSVQDSSGTHLWAGQVLREQMLVSTAWSYVNTRVIHVPVRVGSTVRAYIWNPSPGVSLLLDGLTLKVAENTASKG